METRFFAARAHSPNDLLFNFKRMRMKYVIQFRTIRSTCPHRFHWRGRICLETTTCAMFFWLIPLFAFPLIAAIHSPGTDPVDSSCYLHLDIDSEPVGAHIYFDSSGAEWGKAPVNGWVRCNREKYEAKGCEFGFTAKKSGYTTTHHVIRVTHCRYNSESAAENGEHVQFTMVLDPLK